MPVMRTEGRKCERTMRYGQIDLTPVRLLTYDQLCGYMGCRAWVDRALKAGWFKPVQNGTTKRYDVEDADSCVNRFKAGEWP